MPRKKTGPLPAKTLPSDTSPADVAPILRDYQVELSNVPARVITGCSSHEEAYHRYLELSGIVASDHLPRIDALPRAEAAPGEVEEKVG